MNILIASAGRRAKLVSYLKEELNKIGGAVIAVDCDDSAPALYFADAYEIVPRIEHEDYLPVIKQLCKKYRIGGLISLIDPELVLLAEHKKQFQQEGIHMIISDKETIEICNDKYLTYQVLTERRIPCIPTYLTVPEVKAVLEKSEMNFPLIVKPRKGSASIGIRKIHSLQELQFLVETYPDIIIQPFIEGEEYGVDCYIDLISHQVTNIFAKRKMKMRAGETDKSVAIKDDALMRLIEQLITVLNPVGPIDIDCFKTASGYVISEINPRFGGGYPHAHEAGQNFLRNLINNLQGRSNEKQIGNYMEGSLLIKYDDIIMKNKVLR